MAYTRQSWADAPSTTTPINAARLAHLEDGIFNVDVAAAAAATAAAAAQTAAVAAQLTASSAVPTTAKGAANGVASLDGTGKVPTAQLPAGNQAGVTSVNTRIGAVTLTSADVALGNVNNTTDLLKPISTATQTALNGKMNLGGTVDVSSQLIGFFDQDNFPSGALFAVDYVKSGGVHGTANAWPGSRPVVDTVVAKGPNSAGPPTWLLDGDDWDIVG